MLIGGILFGTAHQALTCMCVSHFPKSPRRKSSTRRTTHRPMPFAQHSRLSLHTRPRLPPGMRRSGRAGQQRRRLLKRRGWRFPIERCCSSPALSKHSETHQLWLGTALQRASDKNRTSCGRKIKPGVWPARSTRRSSSPWVVPATRPKLWLEPCRALFDECATGNRLPYTATRPSASIRLPAFGLVSTAPERRGGRVLDGSGRSPVSGPLLMLCSGFHRLGQGPREAWSRQRRRRRLDAVGGILMMSSQEWSRSA